MIRLAVAAAVTIGLALGDAALGHPALNAAIGLIVRLVTRAAYG